MFYTNYRKLLIKIPCFMGKNALSIAIITIPLIMVILGIILYCYFDNSCFWGKLGYAIITLSCGAFPVIAIYFYTKKNKDAKKLTRAITFYYSIEHELFFNYYNLNKVAPQSPQDRGYDPRYMHTNKHFHVRQWALMLPYIQDTKLSPESIRMLFYMYRFFDECNSSIDKHHNDPTGVRATSLSSYLGDEIDENLRSYIIIVFAEIHDLLRNHNLIGSYQELHNDNYIAT